MAFLYVENQEDALDIVQEVAYQSLKDTYIEKNRVFQNVVDENYDKLCS